MAGKARANIIRILLLAAVLAAADEGTAETKGPAEPSRENKCPVCGMFVYKYPDWIAQMAFQDGSVEFFDGAKDVFKAYFNMKKYIPRKDRRDIAAIFVREYYDLAFIDARRAFFVVGGDVYGPMGHELVPLLSMEDARTFMKDHKGKGILSFQEITPEVVQSLD